jgi:bifunctional DNA-binding transcriptional regulator/antitoxin component of YhaV-PrlF toxin-antitoxin module
LESRDNTQKSRIIGPRSVSKRGGSLQVTIPPEVSEHLGVEEGSKLVFVIDQASGHVTLGRSDKIEITLSRLGKPATLGFTLSKESTRRLLKRG